MPGDGTESEDEGEDEVEDEDEDESQQGFGECPLTPAVR
jgi:ferredoxin